MSRTGLVISLAIAAVVGLMFGIWPDLDLKLAGLFFDPDKRGFWRSYDPLYLRLRDASTWLIALVALPAFGALAVKFVQPRRPLRLPGRAIALMIITLALAPGVVANLIFKEHWHRPRPIDVAEFGGDEHFRAWWDPRGDCAKNCSFVAGEPSGAFWTLAPAVLLPPPWRAAAVAAALVFGDGGRRPAHGGRRAFLHRRGVRRRVRVPGDLADARMALPLAADAHHRRGRRAGGGADQPAVSRAIIAAASALAALLPRAERIVIFFDSQAWHLQPTGLMKLST